jgi:hypothetical protein
MSPSRSFAMSYEGAPNRGTYPAMSTDNKNWYVSVHLVVGGIRACVKSLRCMCVVCMRVLCECTCVFVHMCVLARVRAVNKTPAVYPLCGIRNGLSQGFEKTRICLNSRGTQRLPSH